MPLVLSVGTLCGADDAAESRIEYAPSKRLAYLANQDINESSGLAFSRRADSILWTHNDSGDSPRVFAFDLRGAHRGTYTIPGATAIDWEDMASFVLDGQPCLLLADVGDNHTRRSTCTLYLIKEPDVARKPPGPSSPAKLLQTVHFRYEDSAHDCESIAFDRSSRTVLLLTKTLADRCQVFALAWPETSNDARQPATARSVTEVRVPMATAMDVSPDGRRAIIATYGWGYEFIRRDKEDWGTALRRPGRPVTMPVRRQGESICYGPGGKKVYLTSEKLPTPLFEMSPR